MQDPVRIIRHLPVMSHHDNRLLIHSGCLAHEHGHLLRIFRIQISSGLVGQDNGRGDAHAPGNRHPLLLPAGHLRWKLFPAFCDPQGIHHFLDIAFILLFSVQMEGHGNILISRKLREQAVILVDKPDPAPADP